MLKRHGLNNGANMIAAQIAPIEESFDDVIAAQARLIATTMQARRMAGLPATFGQAILSKTSVALATTVQARGAFIEAHLELAALRDEFGITVTSDGSAGGCPPASAVDKTVIQAVA